MPDQVALRDDEGIAVGQAADPFDPSPAEFQKTHTRIGVMY